MSEDARSGIVKSAETRLPKFVEDAYESVEKMEKFAEILLNSKLVPNHFYEQLPDKKPDFSKGKVPAVVAVLIQGYQLQLPPLTALQHIIPVNGLLSIKGDLAKSMIFNSGKLKPGTWKEEEFGSIEESNLVVKITATRSDNGQTLTRSFSVEQAKRAGLWITEQQVNGQDGWKYKSSAWWKYPARMINYRALGFLARDMFPDVLAGIYTTEEAMDMPTDQTISIDQGNGVTLQIQDKGFAEERSKKITGRAVDKIESKVFTPVTDPEKKEVVIGSVESPFIPDKGSVEYLDGKEISRDVATIEKEDIETIEKLPTEELLNRINADADMIEAMHIIPGKNTQKKLREIYIAKLSGKLKEHVAPHIVNEPENTEPSEQNAGKGIEPNKDFDNAGPEKPEKEELISPESNELNRYNLVIPPFNKGNERDFVSLKELFNALNGIKPRLDNERFLELQKNIPEFAHYKGKEDFCKYATIPEVCELLNDNLISL